MTTASTAMLCLLPAASATARDTPVRPAGGLDVISASGVCASVGRWSMTAASRSLRVVLRVSLTTGRPRQRWKILVLQNENTVLRGTRGSDWRGDVRVRRRVANLPGTDRFLFVARNPVTGQTCRGALDF
jgi:hypothetical protein